VELAPPPADPNAEQQEATVPPDAAASH